MIVEAPGMIEALQNIGMPLVVPANQRSSVRACVQENPQLAVAAADEEKRPPRYIAAPVVAPGSLLRIRGTDRASIC